MMNNKFTHAIIFVLTSAASASVLAAPPTPPANSAVSTESKPAVQAEKDAIFAAMARLSLLLAVQTKRTVVDGKIQSETKPDGTTGTYLYEGDGRLRGISYSDGRAITVMYDDNGNIQSILENGTGRKIVFKPKRTGPNKQDKEIAAAFALEKGKSVLIDRQVSGESHRFCEETNPFPCVVESAAPEALEQMGR